MKARPSPLVRFLACISSLSCVGGLAEGAAPPHAADASNEFAFACMSRLSGEKGNLAFSPFSAWVALTMTSGGAGGSTREEMARVLHLPSDSLAHEQAQTWLAELADAQDIELKVANRLWPSATFTPAPSFATLAKKSYHAALEPLDFAGNTAGSRKKINTWVEKQTGNRIKDLLQPGDLSAGTKLILTNAIYFKAGWASEFLPSDTRPMTFTPSAGSPLQSPMMLRKGSLPYFENGKFQATRLPYRGGQMTMIVVLPKKGHRADDPGLLSKTSFDQVRSGLKSELVVMRLPRFTANQRLSMAPLLESLGMKTAFTDSADFSRMCATEPLKINSVIHQAFVTVGEKGTEAAAATAVSMAAGSAAPREAPKPKLFIADHPFLFFIVDERNGGILFAGRVDMPEITAPEK